MPEGDVEGKPDDDMGTGDQLRAALVQHLKNSGLLPDPRIEAAFREVPRHLFLPGVPFETAYADDAIPIKRQAGIPISSSSQPAVMAVMLDQLCLQSGDRVLEIGAGTGYNAALMAQLVTLTGRVVTVDIDEDLVEGARANLSAGGFEHVQVVCRDGAEGFPDEAPYDRIILTVGAWDIAPAWIDQLRPGGRLVLPLALNGIIQKLVAFEREDDHLVSVSVRDGGFMPLRGALAFPPTLVPLEPEAGLFMALAQPRVVEAQQMRTMLSGPYTNWETAVEVRQEDLEIGLFFWLTIGNPTACGIIARGSDAEQPAIPFPLTRGRDFRATIGLLEDDGLAILANAARPAEQDQGVDLRLVVRGFGRNQQPAQRLIELLRAWEAAGRPSSAGLRLRIYPRDAGPDAPHEGLMIDKPASRIVLDWD